MLTYVKHLQLWEILQFWRKIPSKLVSTCDWNVITIKVEMHIYAKFNKQELLLIYNSTYPGRQFWS